MNQNQVNKNLNIKLNQSDIVKRCKYCLEWFTNKRIRKHEKECLKDLKIAEWNNISKQKKVKRNKKYRKEAKKLLDDTKMKQSEVKKIVEEWLIETIGPRCKSFSDFCPSCEMWRRFDLLFCDIDKEYEWPKELEDTKSH